MRISRNSFDRLVEAAIASLPEEFAQWIDEVPIIVEDSAGPADKHVADALGFYQGDTLLGRLENSGHLPPRIVLFRRNLMDACRSREQLGEEIRKTLVHELGHHAGMDEDELEALGYGPLVDDEEIEWDVEDDEEGPATENRE
jgi:predicted Zn-dependent protease with MMP-like domain